jgi:hypothetical protein
MSVYFISIRELDFVKIGYASNPLYRLRGLQVSTPLDLTLEGAIPGGREKEAELHKKFALARVRGEWFKLTPELQTEISKSTRPERYTVAAVRKWIRKLAEADEAAERREVPPEIEMKINQVVQDRLDTAARRRRMTELERLEADGHIFFPFRVKEEA